MSIDVLSSEELQHIVHNARYREVLSDLLKPSVDRRDELISGAESGDSADHTVTDDQSERGADHTRSLRIHRLQPATRQKRGADTSRPALTKNTSQRPEGARVSESSREGNRKRRQGSDTPGPSSKRTKTASDQSSDEEEYFDPTLEREDREEFKVKVPKKIQKYVEKHFRRSLSKEERTAMLRKHPKPDTAAVAPPRLDSFISDFAGKKLDKGRDAQLAKIQGTMLYAANPLTNLWAELIDQGLTQDSQAAIFVSDVSEIIQRTLVLLGNASNLISETRREVALESVHPSLKKYGKGDFSKAGEDLFGQEFKDNLVKKVEADSAISKAVNIVSRSSSNPNSSGRVYRKQASDNRFFGGRTSRYGAVSGKIYQPYKYQGKGKHTPGKPFHRKGSVFDRLGTSLSNNAGNQQQPK